MSAQDNLSNELFFEAHRGIIGKLDPKYGLGMHFSKSEKTAKRFASRQYWTPGTVVHAKIPTSSVETNTKILGQRGFAGFEGKDPLAEEEIPVKQGSSVFVTGVTKLRAAKPLTGGERKSRTRTYRTPRKMTA